MNEILSNPTGVDSIIEERAIGCVVSKEEHNRLKEVEKADRSLQGWDRYERAGIKVWDMETNKTLKI